MMKKTLLSLSALLTVSLLTGCATSSAPVNGALFTAVQGPNTVTTFTDPNKVGEATCHSILGLIAFGNCSIKSAAMEAGISEITTVDNKSFGILGFYSSFTTVVYGR